MQTDGKATKSRSTFRMEVGVRISIHAKPEHIWGLLTNAEDFPRWNSTIQRVDGDITLGEKIALRTTADPERTFNLTVTEYEPNTRMTWKDGAAPMFKGVRRFTLTPAANDSTVFEMVEAFSGLMLPMIARSLPDFAPTFERYAADLKQEAERRS